MQPDEFPIEVSDQAQFTTVVGMAKAVESASMPWQQFLSLGLRNPSRETPSFSVQEDAGGEYTDVVRLSEVRRPAFAGLLSRFVAKTSTNRDDGTDSAETGLIDSKNYSRKAAERLGSRDVERMATQALQRFECYVEAVGHDVVTARLIDKTGASPNLIAEVLREEIPDADQDVLDVGATFYWSIGYSFEAGGTKRRFSEIRFKRTPRWNRGLQSSADKFVDLFSDFLTDKTDDSSNGARR
jgi:hypothetical protein